MRAVSGSAAEDLFITLFEDVFGAEKTGLLQKHKNLQQPLSCAGLYRQHHKTIEKAEHKPEPCAGCFRLALVFCF